LIRIELIYEEHELVNQCFVFGDSLQHRLVAIVVVNQYLLDWANSIGFNQDTIEELSQSREVCRAVQKSLEAYGKRHGLTKLESIQECYLETKAFTAENGLLTPTGKLRVLFLDIA
jgi:long-chain acyl-CoA synthetase